MSLQVTDISIELVETLCPLLPRIKARDKLLADQLVRAANSITLNCAESEGLDPGNRRARLFTAAGSAKETHAAVRLAVAWRLITVHEGQAPTALLNRISAILWRLTR